MCVLSAFFFKEKDWNLMKTEEEYISSHKKNAKNKKN